MTDGGPGRRDAVLAGTVGARRLVGAAREQASYDAFREDLGLAASPETVTLYLTALLDSGRVHGRGLRYRLGLLDVAARLAGTDVPSRDPDLRRYLRGLHRHAALASPEKGVDALHTETLHAVVDAVGRPLSAQLRDVALLAFANATGLPAQVLADLRWDNVRIRPKSVEVTVPAMPGRGPRPYSPVVVPAGDGRTSVREALLIWRQAAGPANRAVFGVGGAACDVHRIRPVLRLLGPPPIPADIGRPRLNAQAVERHATLLLAPRPRAVRDRALLLIAFTAALGTDEARRLRHDDVRRTSQGLAIRVAGRRESVTAVPATRHGAPCPALAWDAWAGILARSGLPHASLPAFTQIAGVVVKREPLAEQGVNLIVRQACTLAGLTGDYAFTSLRTGFIRTAIRAGAPDHVVGRQAGLSSLRSVGTHARREQLLRNNAASLVGL